MKRAEDYYSWRDITANIAIVLYPIFLNSFSLVSPHRWGASHDPTMLSLACSLANDPRIPETTYLEPSEKGSVLSSELGA